MLNQNKVNGHKSFTYTNTGKVVLNSSSIQTTVDANVTLNIIKGYIRLQKQGFFYQHQPLSKFIGKEAPSIIADKDQLMNTIEVNFTASIMS